MESTNNKIISEEDMILIAKDIINEKSNDEDTYDFAYQSALDFLEKHNKMSQVVNINADNKDIIEIWFKEHEQEIEDNLLLHGYPFTINIKEMIDNEELIVKSKLIVKNQDEAKLIIRNYFQKFNWYCDAEFDNNGELILLNIKEIK